MKSASLFVVLFVFLHTIISAQCLSGDCVNGNGTMKYNNGDTYTGEWQNGVKEGYGRYDWNDGSYYVGYFKNDLFEGLGSFTNANGAVTEGQFSKGELVPPKGCTRGDCVNGSGTYIFPNGDKYTGNWVDGYRTGYGRYDWLSGSYYEGYFLKNELHGDGSYYDINGTIKIGKFEHNNYVEGSTLEKKDDSNLDDLIKEMDEKNAADDKAEAEAKANAIKKDFCATVKDVIAAYPQNFQTLLGPAQSGYLDFGDSWYANLMVENSVSAGISGALLSDSRTYYNILYQTDDQTEAQNKYNDYVALMNSCGAGCCTFVYDTHEYTGDSYQSNLTYWLVFLVNDGYDTAAYENMIVEIEMMSNVIGPKWSILFRVYEFEDD